LPVRDLQRIGAAPGDLGAARIIRTEHRHAHRVGMRHTMVRTGFQPTHASCTSSTLLRWVSASATTVALKSPNGDDSAASATRPVGTSRPNGDLSILAVKASERV
jgi:hypothetical protein